MQGSAGYADVEESVIDFVQGLTSKDREVLLSKFQAASSACNAASSAQLEGMLPANELLDSEAQSLILKLQHPSVMLKKSSIASLKDYISRISTVPQGSIMLTAKQCTKVILDHWGQILAMASYE